MNSLYFETKLRVFFLFRNLFSFFFFIYRLFLFDNANIYGNKHESVCLFAYFSTFLYFCAR